MTYLWDQLEGVSLAGEYGLQEWLGSDAVGAFFLTAYGPGRQRALIKLLPEDPSTGEDQLNSWRRSEQLSHPSLLPLLDCGRAEAAGDSFLYAVFEYPEDNLAGAIQNGPLSEPEVRDILAAAVDALRYLHSEGMVHTSIDADHVVAVGDRIKLGSDSLREARDSGAGYDGDIYALGTLTYELLTGQRIEQGREPDLSGISEPLRSIVEHCLEEDPKSRWTLAGIAEALTPQPSRGAAPEEVEVLPDSAPEEVEQYVDIPEPRRVVYEPFTQAEARNEPSRHASYAPEPKDDVPIAHYVPHAAVVLVALVATVWVIVSHSKPVPQSVAIVPPPAPVVAAPPTPAPVSPARPVVHTATTSARSQKPSPVGMAASPANWRVIAYTYSTYQDAEKKVHHINTQYSGLQAEVFKPGSKRTAFLVALGGHMTREEAQALQRKAVGRGLPRDTYIQNYSN